LSATGAATTTATGTGTAIVTSAGATTTGARYDAAGSGAEVAAAPLSAAGIDAGIAGVRRVGSELCRRDVAAAGAGADESPADEEVLPTWLPRPVRCPGVLDGAEDPRDAEGGESGEADEPASVSSASAIGIATTAEPTPSATASAPT
jgi:hypothetical protein